MQDRFKFRVWDKEQSKYLEFEGFKTGDIEFNFDIETKNIWIEFNSRRYILQQCTGLKDKNGKLIFEGDIVKAVSHNPNDMHIGLIQYHTCYFSLDYKNIGKYGEVGMSLSKDTPDYVELKIIGNVYEHKYLLEVQND